MPRKKQTIHASGLVEVKVTIGKTIEGKRIQKSFYGSSKLEARRKADEYLTQQAVAEKTGELFIAKEYTFEQWAEKWLNTYKKPSVSENTYLFTYQNTVDKHLIPYFGLTKLTDIKNIDIQAFFASKASMSESMLDKMHNCLYSIFDTAMDNDLCYKNPLKNIKIVSNVAKHEKKVYTSAQIEQVKAACFGKMNEVAILLETGLRRGKLLGLQWNDIDYKNGILSVKRSIADSKITLDKISINPPKWDSYRDIPLKETSINLFQAMEHQGEYIFPKQNKKPQSPHAWSQKLVRFMNTLPEELPRLTAHELRHTYGTDLRRQGVDIYTIQKVMGHKDLKMTSELYVHNEIEELKKAMKIKT